MEDKDLREENLQEEAAEVQAEAEVTEAVEAEVVDETEAKMAELEQKAADYLDKYQRCLAEFDNFRKRTSKEKASMYDDGVRAVSYTHLDVYKRQHERISPVTFVECFLVGMDAQSVVSQTFKQLCISECFFL